MKLEKINIAATVVVLLLLTLTFTSAQKAVPESKDKPVTAWVYFIDKGPQALLKEQMPEELLSSRALKRRQKRRTKKALIDYSDWRLYEPYLQQVEPDVKKIRVRSRWLNAVSVEASAAQLQKIGQLECVDKITPVRMFHKKAPQPELQKIHPDGKALKKTGVPDYGNSQTQISLIKTDVLHAKGLSGKGVLIAMLDDGYNLLNSHIVFDSLRADNRIKGTWDFIHNDSSVDDHNYGNDGTHGTKTLSVIGGNTPGELIGTAYKASFLLAKTEMDSTEVPAEEDTWVAGLEWAEINGADIVSSSLGYGYYATDPATSWYTWEDMDGETAVVTIAADMAADKGVLVFNAAGNEKDNSEHNTLTACADGKKVLAIAAVSSSGTRASFSSVGPSADGRIKPDIAAMGSSVTFASSSSDSVFFYNGGGTSFACPLAAGTAALLLEAFPDASPDLVREALRKTASQADAPDKYLGWGIMDASAAYDYLKANTIPGVPHSGVPENLEIYSNYPNPFNPETIIRYRLSSAGRVRIVVFDQTGKRVIAFQPQNKTAGTNSRIITMDGFASGVYYYQIKTTEFNSGRKYSKTGKMILLK